MQMSCVDIEIKIMNLNNFLAWLWSWSNTGNNQHKICLQSNKMLMWLQPIKCQRTVQVEWSIVR